MSGLAGLLGLLGVALILAAFRVDTPMLGGGSPAAWHGGVHGIVFLLIIAMGVLASLTMALAVRGDPGWRPITVMSLAASALFVVFLILPSLSPGRIRPDLYASTTACTRLYRSSFAKILLDYLGRIG